MKLITLLIAEWDDDMTYLYVDYPYYKKYMIFASISAVSLYYKKRGYNRKRKHNLNIEAKSCIVPVPLQLQHLLP
jgi:hypothetical protein